MLLGEPALELSNYETLVPLSEQPLKEDWLGSLKKKSEGPACSFDQSAVPDALETCGADAVAHAKRARRARWVRRA